MLVLTRKPHERLFVGEILIQIIRIKDHEHVRIGITAPPEVEILREELLPADDPRRLMS